MLGQWESTFASLSFFKSGTVKMAKNSYSMLAISILPDGAVWVGCSIAG